MYQHITPVILVYNEAPNIGRNIEKLHWAKEVVVVDSFSRDESLAIIAGFPNTRVVQRKFDSHALQWNFAIKETGINTEWVLALDADYILTPEFIEEIKYLHPGSDTVGYRAGFIYCINGSHLRGTAYPPVTVLYRRQGAVYTQDGHAMRILLNGSVENLNSRILHDDRKSLGQWVHSQVRYMQQEACKLKQSSISTLSWPDRLRCLRFFAPFVMLFYCLFVKGTILNGKHGIYYAFQRMFAELLLSLYLLERDITSKSQVIGK